MKTLKLLSFFIAVALFSGCKNDDDATQDASLEGVWKLTRVQGGFGGVDEEFEPGVITWDFNFENQTVTVVNNQTPESGFDFFDSGIYSFSVLSAGDPQSGTMIINELDFGYPTVGNQKMTLDQRESDGFFVTLKR